MSAEILPMETKEQRDARLAAVRAAKVKLLLTVIDAEGATMADVVVTRYLLMTRHNNDTGLCCPSRARMIKDTGLSDRALSRSVARLKNAGLFVVQPYGGTMTKGGGTCSYIPNLSFEGAAKFGGTPEMTGRQEWPEGHAKNGDHNHKESNHALPSGETAPLQGALETDEGEPGKVPPLKQSPVNLRRKTSHARRKPTPIDPAFQPSDAIRNDPLFAGLDMGWHVAEFVGFWTSDGGQKIDWQRTFRSRLVAVVSRQRGNGRAPVSVARTVAEGVAAAYLQRGFQPGDRV